MSARYRTGLGAFALELAVVRHGRARSIGSFGECACQQCSCRQGNGSAVCNAWDWRGDLWNTVRAALALWVSRAFGTLYSLVRDRRMARKGTPFARGPLGNRTVPAPEKSDVLSWRSKVYGLPREDKVKMRKLSGGKSSTLCRTSTTGRSAPEGRIIDRISPDSWCAVLKVTTPVSVARALRRKRSQSPGSTVREKFAKTKTGAFLSLPDVG